MIKKAIIAVIGLSLTLTLSIVFLSIGKDLNQVNYETPSETFAGAISEDSYETKGEAAKAFLTNELAGASANPVYLGCRTNRVLTQRDIIGLAVDPEIKGDITSAESLQVYYIHNDTRVSTEAYLLVMNDEYRYYVLPSAPNELVTNSYLNTVLDGAKYLNCTATTSVKTKLQTSESNFDVSYRQTIMFDDVVAYLDQDIFGLDNEIYFAEENGSINLYITHPYRKDGKFYSLAELNSENSYTKYEVKLIKGKEQISVDTLSSLQEITDFMFLMNLDGSYFVKTDYGFKMTEEKYKDVCKIMIDKSSYEEMEKAWEEYIVSFSADYYVTDGRLSASKVSLCMSNGDDVFVLDVVANYTDFGTTVVALPEGNTLGSVYDDDDDYTDDLEYNVGYDVETGSEEQDRYSPSYGFNTYY